MTSVVVRRSAPKELSDHLTLNASFIADNSAVMHDLVLSWSIAKRDWKQVVTSSSSPTDAAKSGPMQIGAMDKGKGKGKVKGYGDKGKNYGGKGYGKHHYKGYDKGKN